MKTSRSRSKKIELRKAKAYAPAFVKKILESRKQAKAGKVTTVKPAYLWT